LGFSAGTRLGSYEIVSPLGVGGMGEVYRARDSKLRRLVAIKVLPPEVASDREKVDRFRLEARILASLNHPNIASIYGFEDSSKPGLVMELAEGPTLADRILGGRIPVEEALTIAKQVCDALEYAHEKGIVHRDVKPANIKLSPDGSVKLLDFGLAKALESVGANTDISSSPTFTHLGTQAGMILSTAAYMSPEQVKGKAIDRRSDIWAFGCVLFEMLTSRMVFSGETVTDTLAEIIKAEPNWSQVFPNTPKPIRALLQRCLRKDLKQRLQAIGDARIVIEEVLAGKAPPDEQPTQLYMRRFVLGWKKLGHEGRLKAYIVNYADDLVICCRSQAEEALATMRSMMSKLKLTVNDTKTRVCKLPEEKFDFLGYTFGRCYSPKTGRAYLGITPSQKRVQRICEAISQETGRNKTLLTQETEITTLNRMMVGWANYFCLGSVSKAYRAVERHARKRLRQWLCAKHKLRGQATKQFSITTLHQVLSLVELTTRTSSFPWARP
jgi:serine/threonine protein kinase